MQTEAVARPLEALPYAGRFIAVEPGRGPWEARLFGSCAALSAGLSAASLAGKGGVTHEVHLRAHDAHEAGGGLQKEPTGQGKVAGVTAHLVPLEGRAWQFPPALRHPHVLHLPAAALAQGVRAISLAAAWP